MCEAEKFKKSVYQSADKLAIYLVEAASTIQKPQIMDPATLLPVRSNQVVGRNTREVEPNYLDDKTVHFRYIHKGQPRLLNRRDLAKLIAAEPGCLPEIAERNSSKPVNLSTIGG